MTTIPDVLRESARRWPEGDAIVEMRNGRVRSVTFDALQNAAAAFAEDLRKAGVRPGDVILVFVPLSIRLYASLLGVFELGAAAMFLDPSAGRSYIERCCRLLPPRALVAPWPVRAARHFLPALRAIPSAIGPAGIHARRSQPAASEIAPDSPALITFTSGSTGQPKAAVRSHRFLLAQHEALRDAIQLDPGERDLTTLPVFVLANLASGVTSILPDAAMRRPGSVNAARLKRQIALLRPSRTGGSPAFYSRLATVPGALEGFGKIYTGGAPVFPALLRLLKREAPDADIVAVYGSTEAEPIAHVSASEISPADWLAMQGGAGLLAGHPVPQVSVRIIPDQWGTPDPALDFLPAGSVGEILVFGPHVLTGYLNGQGDSESKVREGGRTWHRTGDAGRFDADGRLWLMGRCSAKISDETGILYPFTIECIAMSFPGIVRAACLQYRGKRVLALEGDMSLRRDIERVAATFEINEVLEFPRIPVDPRHNAKVFYPELLRLLHSRLTR